MIKVLVIGQTPPPYGGQAMSIKLMLDGVYKNIKFFHVRMAFSRDMDEIGKFRFSKVLHLMKIIFLIIYYRFRLDIPILYFVPAGPERIPMYRDFAILIFTRWLFKKIVFQFRAAGISEIYKRLLFFERLLYRLAYFKADLAISLSEYNPPDGIFLQAKKNVVVSNGAEDHYAKTIELPISQKNELTLLYVGVLRESKGIKTILEACKILMDAGLKFRIRFMGKLESQMFKENVEEFIRKNNMPDYVEFMGVQTGDMKWTAYRNADIFLFPSYFESEAMPRVVLEAMMFQLPVVATKWRGIPSLVEDGKSGYLIPVRDSRSLADKVAILLNDDGLRQEMGKRGRAIYLERFTAEKFWKNMEKTFLSIQQ